MRVFITGGTGLIGTRLVRKLFERGDKPVVLTRRYGAARQVFGPAVDRVEGAPRQGGDGMRKVDDCAAVIPLAGENVFARRWNAAFKQTLVDSRVKSTQNIASALLR